MRGLLAMVPPWPIDDRTATVGGWQLPGLRVSESAWRGMRQTTQRSFPKCAARCSSSTMTAEHLLSTTGCYTAQTVWIAAALTKSVRSGAAGGDGRGFSQ
jgi:hypothetical protein